MPFHCWEVNAQERAGEMNYEDQLSLTRKMRRMEVGRGRRSRIHPTIYRVSERAGGYKIRLQATRPDSNLVSARVRCPVPPP